MIKLKTASISLIFIIFLGSCSVTDINKSSRSANFAPDLVKMQVTPDDYQLLGEVEVTSQYCRYFCIIKIMDHINGSKANRRVNKSMQLYGDKWTDLSKSLRRAMYKVHEKYPSGEIVVPAYKIVEKKKMFLGRRVKERLKVKVYRIKN